MLVWFEGGKRGSERNHQFSRGAELVVRRWEVLVVAGGGAVVRYGGGCARLGVVRR